MNTEIKWSENVIIADVDYVDKVAFDLIVNFERMIMRRISPADLAQWLVCIALDGGLRKGENETQAILIHSKQSVEMENFLPSRFEDELHEKAFRDKSLGEFSITPLAIENIISEEEFFLDVLSAVCAQENVKRVMVIPNAEKEQLYSDIRETLRHVDEEKHITVFSMQPMLGGNFRQEILGYSLMNALGIKSDELEFYK
ncbi:MAG: hypothetical protein IJV27_12845 [Prevotella sp.]|nr:hypothetical protein [Prevotella sp.]